MRVARPIVLTPESRIQLERQARGRSVPMRVAVRSRIVLLAADGKQHKQNQRRIEDQPADGGVVAREISAARGRGIAERCSSARTHAVDSSSDGQHGDQEDHPNHSGQRNPLVYAHHGT
jgi:hypothetical protein